MSRLIKAALALVMLAGMVMPAWSQSTRTYPVTFTLNVPQANVLVNRVPIKGPFPVTINYPPGDYIVGAMVPGYPPFSGKFSVTNSGLTFDIVIQVPMYPVTINSNVPNANIVFNGSALKPAFPQSVNVAPGTYSLSASAPGYEAYSTSVTVPAGGTSVSVQLQSLKPALFPVTLSVNPANALVTFDRMAVKGRYPLVLNYAPGTYEVTASAPGYDSFSMMVNVAGPTPVNIQLQPAKPVAYPMTFSVNVPGAVVTVNQVPLKGRFPLTVNYPEGSYQVTASAPGYDTYTGFFQVPGATQNISLNLVASAFPVAVTSNAPQALLTLAGQAPIQLPTTLNLGAGVYQMTVTAEGYETFSTTLQVNGPMKFPVNLTASVSKMNAQDLTVFIDGVQQPAGSFNVSPGRHKVKVMLGTRVLGEKNYVFRPNVDYDIDVMLDFEISENAVINTNPGRGNDRRNGR